ncbi:MAG: hypothetical protein ACYT04_36165 [Nostoc sp.]
MKTDYSRLLTAFVSSVYIATTVGLSAQPGLSLEQHQVCQMRVDSEEFLKGTVVIVVATDGDNTKVKNETGTIYEIVPTSYLDNCHYPEQ